MKNHKIKEIELEIFVSTSPIVSELRDAQAYAICVAVTNNCIVKFEFNGVYYSFNAPSLLSTVYTEETIEGK